MTVASRPTAGDYLARNRGGGLFTETVNQRIAAHMCVVAARFNLHPTVLTLTNLALGLAASTTVIALADEVRGGGVPAAVIGLAALVSWQFAYSLDCADGQLARVSGRTSPAGKRIDILADVAMQISLVTAVVAVADAPAVLAAVFAGTWMVNLVTSVLQQGDAAQSLVTSSSPVVRVVKLIRDYGAVVTLIGLVLALIPQWTVWLMVGFTAVNGLFLLASVAAAARASLTRQ
jgi:phosphatidylglycerophosphate synthase